MTEANDLLMGGAPSLKFDNVGVRQGGQIVRKPTTSQQTEYRTRAPKYWDDGSPMMQVILTVQTSERDASVPGDNGERRLFVKGRNLTAAVREAIRAAGARGVDMGGHLYVTWTGTEPSQGGGDPAKTYQAEYFAPTPEAVAALQQHVGQSPAQPAPQQYYQPPAQAPQPSPYAPATQPPGPPQHYQPAQPSWTPQASPQPATGAPQQYAPQAQQPAPPSPEVQQAVANLSPSEREQLAALTGQNQPQQGAGSNEPPF